MKTALLELLRQREIIHPTRIATVEVEHRQLRITVVGYPWWQAGGATDEGQIVLSFEGIAEGTLDANSLLDMEDDEALENFSVSPLGDEEWAAGDTVYDTYCSAPLTEPLRLYAQVEDFLWQLRAPRSARDYLNVVDGSIMRFCEMTRSNSFLLARAPERLHQIISAELVRQQVRHNVLTSIRPAAPRLFVEIGDANFVCETATAEL